MARKLKYLCRFDVFDEDVLLVVLFDNDGLLWLFLTGLQRHPYLGCSRLAGCVHSSVNKPGANGRVSYNRLTHSRLYCRDREKK